MTIEGSEHLVTQISLMLIGMEGNDSERAAVTLILQGETQKAQLCVYIEYLVDY